MTLWLQFTLMFFYYETQAGRTSLYLEYWSERILALGYGDGLWTSLAQRICIAKVSFKGLENVL